MAVGPKRFLCGVYVHTSLVAVRGFRILFPILFPVLTRRNRVARMTFAIKEHNENQNFLQGVSGSVCESTPL